VDDIARRHISEFAVQPHCDPHRAPGGRYTVNDHWRRFRIVEDMDEISDAIHDPDLLLVRGEGDPVAGAAVRDIRAVGLVQNSRQPNPGTSTRWITLPALTSAISKPSRLLRLA